LRRGARALEDRVSGEQGSLRWHTYEIPLMPDPSLIRIGMPDSTEIQFARLWIDNAATPMRIYIAAMDLVEHLDTLVAR
jgi:hypothetical protein